MSDPIELTLAKIGTTEGIAEINRMLREIYDMLNDFETRISALEP